MRIVAILQARMGSTRLPGKSLLPLGGRPVVLRVAERAAAAPGVEEVVVATTNRALDDPLAEVAQGAGYACVRGSEIDVLDRFRDAAQAAHADVIVRLTADCPLHDPAVIGRVLDAFKRDGFDYASNVHPPTFPDGLDTEVFTAAALDRAWRAARLPSEREHVTPHMWNNPNTFRVLNVVHTEDLSHHRWVLDNPRDLTFIQAVYEALHQEGKIFGMDAVLRLLRARPDLASVNRDEPRNQGYVKSLAEDAVWRGRHPGDIR